MEISIKDVTPMFSRIVVEKDDNETTNSGLFIPESARKGSMVSLRGLVVAAGDEVDSVEVGDVILFGQYSGTNFKIGDAWKKKGEPSYLIMNQDDVLCKITKDGKE